MFVALIDIHWWWHDGGKWFYLSEIGLSVVSILPLKKQSWIGKIVKRQIIFYFVAQSNKFTPKKMPFKNAFLKHHPLQKSSTICNDTTKIFKIMSQAAQLFLKIMTQLLLLPCSTTHRDLKMEKVEFRN